MSASRQVLTMSQATSLPAGSLVARMSQILILQALRASFSAFSSAVISGSLAGAASGAGVPPDGAGDFSAAGVAGEEVPDSAPGLAGSSPASPIAQGTATARDAASSLTTCF